MPIGNPTFMAARNVDGIDSVPPFTAYDASIPSGYGPNTFNTPTFIDSSTVGHQLPATINFNGTPSVTGHIIVPIFKEG